MKNEYYSLERYLFDEIKIYKKKIMGREKEKTNLLNNTDLQDYQRSSLARVEDDFITLYQSKIKEREMVIKDKDFIYRSDMLTSHNILNPTHILFILDAYWKLKKFEDAKIDTKGYQAIKENNPDIPDSPAMIRKEFTETLRFANYSDKAVRKIMKAVIGNASKIARKQDEKTKDGRTIHIFQTTSRIE